MFKVNLFVLLLVVGLFFQNSYADDDIGSALQKTQDCLRHQNCDSLNTDTGRTANQNALEAVDGNDRNKQELYNISAEIMPILLQQAGEDPAKMQATLLKAQTDPESFLNSLPPEIQVKIKNAAILVEKNQKSGQ